MTALQAEGASDASACPSSTSESERKEKQLWPEEPTESSQRADHQGSMRCPSSTHLGNVLSNDLK